MTSIRIDSFSRRNEVRMNGECLPILIIDPYDSMIS
jgi:hypothetical protein